MRCTNSNKVQNNVEPEVKKKSYYAGITSNKHKFI